LPSTLVVAMPRYRLAHSTNVSHAELCRTGVDIA
jgi:hypothetical protein